MSFKSNRVLYSERHEAGAKGDANSLWDERRYVPFCGICHGTCTPASACNLGCSHRFHAKCYQTCQEARLGCPVCHKDALLGICKMCYEPLRVADLHILPCSHSFHSACATKIKAGSCPVCMPESQVDERPPETETWRLRDRTKTKTTSGALILCLNIGTEPPDVVKFSPCARNECWINPLTHSRKKSLETIGTALQNQYSSLQSRAIYQQLLDPTVDELRNICTKLRHRSRGDRMLFHYNGHGVPKPTANGELWFFNENYSQYIPLSLNEIRKNIVGTPTFYVIDCSNAGIVMPYLTKPLSDIGTSNGPTSPTAFGPSSHTESKADVVGDIVMVPCGPNELLPRDAAYPADLFTTCLTTPMPMALRWFVLQNKLAMDGVEPDSVDSIPGKLSERKTPMGELNWVFTAITDSIAWNCLPLQLFHQLFRQDIMVASCFRNFFLADRILRSLGCTPATSPALPSNISLHPLWESWDLAAESTLSAFLGLRIPPVIPSPLGDHLGGQMTTPSPPTCNFFAEQLTAFEVWLDVGRFRSGPPEHLPIVLQVLLSQAHRLRALQLLLVFFDRHGPQAVSLALNVGIHPYVLKLLQSPAPDLRQVLISIWAKIIAYDKKCQEDLMSPQPAPSPRGTPSSQSPHLTFLAHLVNTDDIEQQTNAAFVVAGICNGYLLGQTKCLESGLHNTVVKLLRFSASQRLDPLMYGQSASMQDEMQSMGLASDPIANMSDHRPQQRMAVDDSLLRRWLCLCVAELCRDCPTAQAVCTLQSMTHIALFECFIDPAPEVRGAAIYALACMISSSSVPSSVEASWAPDARLQCDLKIVSELQSILQAEGSPLVRREIVFAFATFILSHPIHKYGLHRCHVLSGEDIEGSSEEVASKKDKQRIEEYSWVEEPTRLQVYSDVLEALTLLSGDPFPAVASIARHVKLMASEDSKTPLWVETCEVVKTANQVHGIYPWSRAHFGEREDTSDPLSKQGTKELYWRNRNLSEKQRVSEFESDCGTQLADYKKEAERLDAELSVSSDNRNISGVLRPSSLFRPTGPVGDVTGEKTPSPPKLVSFDASTILESNAEMTTLLSFHPFEPLLATGDDTDGISLWAYEQGERCWQLRNGNTGESRMTSLEWVNENGPSRLAVASDDGMVRLWGGLGGFNKGPRLVSSLNAVPDLTMGWDGSGLVTAYSHPVGHLFAGGQSPNLRLWDLKSERCVAKWTADSKGGSCVSALGVTNGATKASSSVLDEAMVLSGFGDGALRLFDARLPKDRNAVASWHEHRAWVVGVHLSSEYGVISGSVHGDVNFLDLRSSGAVRTLDTLADRSATMTSLAVHPHAPILAVGTHAQFIKIMTMDGYVLSRIKYHDGFLGQRIGPVSCLKFHPHRPVMAAGATDSIISVYHSEY